MYILQRRNRSPQSYSVPHSIKPSIYPSVNRSLWAPLLPAHSSVVEGNKINVMVNVLWESPLFCTSFVVVYEKKFQTTGFTGFSQINDMRLSFLIMLNAVLQMAVMGRDRAFIRPSVHVSAFSPQAFSTTDSFRYIVQCCKEGCPPSLSLLLSLLLLFVLQYSVHHVTFVLKKLETTLEILVLFFHLFFILI